MEEGLGSSTKHSSMPAWGMNGGLYANGKHPRCDIVNRQRLGGMVRFFLRLSSISCSLGNRPDFLLIPSLTSLTREGMRKKWGK